MTYSELLNIIKKRHKYITDPSDEELQAVIDDLVQLEETKGFVTNRDLDIILNNNIINNRELLQQSEDLTAEINLAQQILDKLRK